MAKGKGNIVGSWAFLIGVVLAIVLGLIGNISEPLIIVLVIIGLIVGLLNIAADEAMPFMMSGAVLIISSYFGQQVISNAPVLNDVLQALLAIFVPATIIVAIRNVFSIASKSRR